LPGDYGRIGVAPGVDTPATGFFGGKAGRIGGFQDLLRRSPARMHRYQADTGPDRKIAPVVIEAKVTGSVTDLLRQPLRLLE
jgi:hypothetical protein